MRDYIEEIEEAHRLIQCPKCQDWVSYDDMIWIDWPGKIPDMCNGCD